jgi:hypothetical protein
MIDRYKHLNKEPLVIKQLGIEEIAVAVESANYGTHRLLSAIARLRLAESPDDELGLVLKEALDRGLY